MEGGERKEEASLPPDYVSLAQLQERWLRKQEERKLKEKQEEEDKRERDARAQNEKNQNRNENKNQRGCAKMAGGIVRAMDVVQGKGKGKEKKEMEEEEITKKKKNQRKKRKFKGAGAVEEKGKVGVEAEALNGGDRCGGVEIAAGGAGILRGEGGSGGALSGVEEVGYVCVVEVSPRNGEIAHVKRTDLRGGFRKNGRNEGSRRVNELKQSEMALNMEKEKEKEKETETEKEKEKEKETEKEKEKEKKEGEKGCGMKWRERGRGRGRGRGSGRGRGRERRGERGRNGGYHERRINSVNEYRPVVLEGNEVDSKLETKVEDEISEVCSEISSLNVGDRNGIWGRDSKAKEDAVDGEGLNGDKVAVKIEKKVDHEVLTRKRENLGFGRGRRYTGPQVSDSGHRMKWRESVKVWVKKKDNLGS